jgi:dihydrofolate reductase
MRALTYLVATSLDGFIAGPDGSFDAFPMQGDHIDALIADYPETLPGPALAALGIEPSNDTFDTVIMGWNTFAIGFDQGLGNPYPSLRTYVFSRSHTLGEPSPNLQISAEDPLAVLRRLKQEPSDRQIWLCGGSALAAQLEPEIDRLVLKLNPILLGAGKPLFGLGSYAARSFELQASRRFQSGVMWNSYQRKRG